MLSHLCPLSRSTSGDTVQLVEQSLDTNLLNNAVKLKITHCPLLPGGVHVQETLNNVTILIVTNQTVHRLVLPHPTRMYRSVSPSLGCFYTKMHESYVRRSGVGRNYLCETFCF